MYGISCSSSARRPCNLGSLADLAISILQEVSKNTVLPGCHFCMLSHEKCVRVQALLKNPDYLWAPSTIQEDLANGLPNLDCYPSYSFCWWFLVNRASFLVPDRHIALISSDCASCTMERERERWVWLTLSFFCGGVVLRCWECAPARAGCSTSRVHLRSPDVLAVSPTSHSGCVQTMFSHLGIHMDHWCANRRTRRNPLAFLTSWGAVMALMETEATHMAYPACQATLWHVQFAKLVRDGPWNKIGAEIGCTPGWLLTNPPN